MKQSKQNSISPAKCHDPAKSTLDDVNSMSSGVKEHALTHIDEHVIFKEISVTEQKVLRKFLYHLSQLFKQKGELV